MNFIVLHGETVAHYGVITREDIGVMVCGVSGEHELCYSDAEGYVVRTELEKPEDFQPFKYLWRDGAFTLNPDFVPPLPSNAELAEQVKRLEQELTETELALAEMYEQGGQHG